MDNDQLIMLAEELIKIDNPQDMQPAAFDLLVRQLVGKLVVAMSKVYKRN